MGQLKKSSGNMYPWVTHMHAHVGGKCPHECRYCYVEGPEGATRNPLYDGPVRLIPGSLDVDYGTGKTIFIDHMNDLFAVGVSDEIIKQVLEHCDKYRNNAYVFQTKNPQRYLEFIDGMPYKCLLGTTIETNRSDIAAAISKAPAPRQRALGLVDLRVVYGVTDTFMTVEPILDFDVDELLEWIHSMSPKFVNIGADSKGHGLPEPSPEKIRALIAGIQAQGIEIREKHNLERLIGPL